MVQGRDLPQELTDAIIDCLYDDRVALRSCALVARSWRARSYLHYYRSVEVTDTRFTPESIQFLDAAASLAASICQLTITQDHRTHHGPIAPRTLIGVLQRLSSLHTLTLGRGVEVGPFDSEEELHLDCARLHSLELDFSQRLTLMSGVEEAVRTMAIFSRSRIDTLRIVGCQYMYFDEVDASSLAALFPGGWRIGALVIGRDRPGTHGSLFEVFRWILSPKDVHTLDAMHIGARGIWPHFAGFLEHISRALRCLRWDVTSSSVPDSSGEFLYSVRAV